MGVAPRHRRGFTLAEAVIAGGIVSIMFAAAMAALTVATRTVDPPAEQRLAGAAEKVLDLLQADLESATAVSLTGVAGAMLVVPDRDSDGDNETIQFDWVSGTKTLTRSYNHGVAEALLAGVSACDIVSLTHARPGIATVADVGTPFALAAAPDHDVELDIGPSLLTGYALVSTPTLPTATAAWKVTGLRLRGRRGAAPGAFITVALRTVSNGFPSSTVLASTDVRGSTFPVSTDWVTVDWPDVAVPAGTTSLGVTITSGSILSPCILEAMVAGKLTPWDTLFSGTLVLWTSLPSNDLSYELLGEISLPQGSLDVAPRGLRIRLTLDGVPGKEFSRSAILHAGTAAAAVP